MKPLFALLSLFFAVTLASASPFAAETQPAAVTKAKFLFDLLQPQEVIATTGCRVEETSACASATTCAPVGAACLNSQDCCGSSFCREGVCRN